MLATIPPPLLAADVWEVVIGIIFFVLYIIGQLIGAREQAKKKKPPRRQPPRPPQQPAGAPPPAEMAAPQPAGQEEALRREVEDFLRRVQGKPPRQEQSPKRPAARRAASEPTPRQPLVSRPTAKPATNLRKKRERESVAQHVAEHISSKQLAEHAERLGGKVATADESLKSHLRDTFDHQLGDLQQQKATTAPKQQQPNVAAEIAELLRKPGGMRQLIVAQEILQRPDRF